MAEIVAYDWELGNGDTSSRSNPISSYLAGIYPVQVLVTLADGSKVLILEEGLIQVSESNLTLLDKDVYIDTDNKLSLHYGVADTHGIGWSLNSGDDMVYPESNAAIVEYEEDGIIYKLAWDMFDDKQYIVNTRKCSVMDAVYTDKAGNGSSYKDVTEGTDIIATIKLPEFEASLPNHELKHMETTVQFRPELSYDSFRSGFEVDFTLITDQGENEVEVARDVDVEKEILFYYQNNRSNNRAPSDTDTDSDKSNQLKVVTNTSKFQFLGFQSHYRRIDAFDRAKVDLSDSSVTDASVMLKLGSPTLWLTRGTGYTTNRGTGTYALTHTSTVSPGPDGMDTSAGLLASGATIATAEPSASMLVWTKNGLPVSSGQAFTLFGTSGEFSLYYVNGTSWADTTFETNEVVFDLRYLAGKTLTSDEVQLYYDKFIEFLPRA